MRQTLILQYKYFYIKLWNRLIFERQTNLTKEIFLYEFEIVPFAITSPNFKNLAWIYDAT